jgi:hypothetical protein
MNISLRPQQPTTLRGALRHGLLNSLRLFVPGAAIFAVAALQPINMTFEPSPGHSTTSVSAAERMVEQGQCWVGDAPTDMQGEFPGHVWADGKYLGERGVSRALEQIFDGVDHGMQVQAFCR